MSLLATNELFSFCYGSNMKLAYLRDYCPSARPVMHAFLPNYRIEFRRFSTDMNGGISTIIEHPGGLIRGVLCAVRVTELETLDILEDVPLGLYKRESFRVLGEDNEWHLGDLYRVVKPEGPFVPADGYLDLMLEGAREHGLPQDYIESIAARRGLLDQA
jgi:hypothetical protein